MDALAAGHDAAVQMIDTSVVRVHQHGACIADNNHQDMGRSRGGLTSKIHAVVDTNGLRSSSRPLNASCAVPEAQGARPACPPPPPKNPLNADSGFGNGACCAGASATADEAGGVSATRLGLCLTALERLAMLLPAV